MQRSCNSTDAQRRKLKSDFCDTQYVVVFEEFEFCIKELVFFFEEHISDQVIVLFLEEHVGRQVVFIFKLSAEKERNHYP